ncbi:MAG: MFS transporter [Cyanobacteriota bacterium]|nr:MFS transporter [Cyanobacteriota bacterium]
MNQAQAGARTPKSWWSQFPLPLRRVVLIRLIASIGAGGVLYLTPLVFHREAFSATSVTLGVALAALAGTVGRFASGALLDRGRRCSGPVLLAVGCAMAGDLQLMGATHVEGYIAGQLLLGLSMGLYWPAIELAVALSAGALGSPRGYALARSADALGIACGALLGALLASLHWIRGIYAVDLLALLTMAIALLRSPLAAARSPGPMATEVAPPLGRWLPPLVPVLLISLVATAVPVLMQSALPLDLVRGGLQRAPMTEGLGALLVGAQLVLLVLIQWPLGRALAERPVHQGLRLSLLAFALGSLLLALSSLEARAALPLVLLAQLPLAVGLAAFLPTATEAVVELSPGSRQGLAMALFSQCFAISALVAPPLAGWMLDGQGHGVGVWTLLSVVMLLAIPLLSLIERHQRRRLLTVLFGSQAEADQALQEGSQTLYRLEASDSEASPPR